MDAAESLAQQDHDARHTTRRKLREAESLLTELVAICEEAAVDLAHAGVSDDGRHNLSGTLMRLRECRTERFERFHPDARHAD